jgi:FkbM family methyltransferase
MLAELGSRLFEAGFRKPVAAAASMAYSLRGGGLRFSVDEHRHWVNEQPEATIVSPVPHTTRYSAYRDWVIDNWAFGYLPREGDVVIDVGAGVGEEAVTFSKLVGPSGHVVSIEAHPETYSCLVETIRRSGLGNVTAVCAAVSDADGTATIGSVSNHLANSIVDGADGTDVPARSLDSLADELGLDRVSLVKMNIEGAERLAVRGMERLAPRTANVCISCHDFVSDRDGGDVFRTKQNVRLSLEHYGFAIATRPQDRRPWVRDYLYGSRAA